MRVFGGCCLLLAMGAALAACGEPVDIADRCEVRPGELPAFTPAGFMVTGESVGAIIEIRPNAEVDDVTEGTQDIGWRTLLSAAVDTDQGMVFVSWSETPSQGQLLRLREVVTEHPETFGTLFGVDCG